MIKFCLISFFTTRIFYITVIILSYAFFLGKYEQAGELLEIDENVKMTNFESLLLSFLKHFYSYDSVHFIHIAKNNYTTDFNYAFFPLFPLLIRYFCLILQIILKIVGNALPFTYVHNIDTIYLLSGFLASNILCLFNTIILYRLSFFLTNSKSKSKLITFLFLINPGTIFFITIYSENLYLCLHLLLILIILVNQFLNKIFAFVFFLILVMTTRSTSLFLCAYFIIPIINNIILNGDKKYESENFLFNLKKLLNSLKSNIPQLGKICLLTGHCFICFMWMTKIKPTNDICISLHNNYKHNVNYSEEYDKILGDYRNTCFSKGGDNVYAFLQHKYWNVGFLSQYKLESLDRIILSLPMNIVAILMILTLFRYFKFTSLFKLKLDKFFVPEMQLVTEDQHQHDHVYQFSKRELLYNSFIFASFVNFLINFLVVVFIAHPQINNRVYTTCPILFFFCADEVFTFAMSKKTYWRGLLILIFFVLFSILGCIMQTGSYGFA